MMVGGGVSSPRLTLRRGIPFATPRPHNGERTIGEVCGASHKCGIFLLYSPNVGEEVFSEVRGELIWEAVLFWDFYGNDLRLRNYKRTLVA